MRMTREDHAAVTFDHLLTFIAQVELGDARMDTNRLRSLLCAAIESEQDAAANKLLTAALELVHANR